MQTLNNQTALVTGTSSSIGQDIAVKLAQMGANVVITGRKEAPLKETAALHGNASKAALKTLTFVWAKELAKDGIRVNNIAVGPIETPIYDKTELSAEEAQAHKDRVTSLVPLGRFGQPKDISAIVALLLSEEGSFITGADIAVDGGFGI